MMSNHAYLYSSAFTECLNKRERKDKVSGIKKGEVTLIIRAPQLRSFEHLALIGASSELGSWDIKKALPMQETAPNEWQAVLDKNKVGNNIEFKFIALNIKDNTSVLWEDRFNRNLHISKDASKIDLGETFFPIRQERYAGTLIPIFSLRTKKSFGVGDFGDLKAMIDFVASTGQKVLQVLPINDTTITYTWTDSYPYSCISIFALHPQYANLNALPQIKDENKRKYYERLKEELNALKEIDYERVNKAKTEYLYILFEQEGEEVMKSKAYKEFLEDTKTWLGSYAEFCYKRDHKPKSNAPIKPKSSDFYYYVQYVLDTQMREAHDYARSKRVILKGDIPIGVSRYGCDVWSEPKYFNLNGQAGAPPDNFSVNGQNWGFPTYNWEEMLKDDCQWWVRRFKNMSRYFDAYRIDHVLGFFRIWDIPIDAVNGLLGQFSPALGFTREEIESYGLRFQEELFTKPFISEWILQRVFGEDKEEVKSKYLVHSHNDIYNLKEECNTERKVEALFEGLTSERDIKLRDGLYALVSNVLFLRDYKNDNKFHPRISAQFSFIYEALWDSDKTYFNNLYNDYYYRRNNVFWYEEAMKKLPKLTSATSMLVCAEDLGMVPACVPWVMNELGVLSLELQSMPKDSSLRFGNVWTNPYLSVCTISSHDMPTLRQWWDEDWARTQDYYNNVLNKWGDAPHPLSGVMAQDIVEMQLNSPSMLCILSLQDWLAMDEELRLPNANAERINIPANPKHYWRYRMHLNIEDLMKTDIFKGMLAYMIRKSGRI